MKTKSVVLCIAILAGASSAHAGSWARDTVQDVTIETGEHFARIAVGLKDITIGRPDCHDPSGYRQHYGFDISTPKGKALLATATAALLAGKTVQLAGTGTCIAVTETLMLEELATLTLFSK